MLRNSRHLLVQFFYPSVDIAPRCIHLRHIPARWWEEECKNFILETCGISEIVQVGMPLNKSRGTSEGICYMQLQTVEDAKHVVQIGREGWGFTSDDCLPPRAPAYHILRGRYIQVSFYKAKVPVATLEQDALRATYSMDVERFLCNPDIIDDIERMHNPIYLFPGMKRKQL